MATWTAVRRDKYPFINDVTNNPGKTYYVIVEIAEPDGTTLLRYDEIRFKRSRFWGGTYGHLAPEGALAHFGSISDEKPVGITHMSGLVAKETAKALSAR